MTSRGRSYEVVAIATRTYDVARGSSAAGRLRRLFPYDAPGAVGVVEPALRQRHALAGAALPAPGGTELGDRERGVGIELLEQPVELREGADQGQVTPEVAPGGEALEVPRDVLAELLAAA